MRSENSKLSGRGREEKGRRGGRSDFAAQFSSLIPSQNSQNMVRTSYTRCLLNFVQTTAVNSLLLLQSLFWSVAFKHRKHKNLFKIEKWSDSYETVEKDIMVNRNY